MVWLFRFFVGEKFPQLVFVGKVVNRLVEHFLHPPLVELRDSRFVYIHLENVLPLEFAHRFFVTIFSNEADELVHALVELTKTFQKSLALIRMIVNCNILDVSMIVEKLFEGRGEKVFGYDGRKNIFLGRGVSTLRKICF